MPAIFVDLIQYENVRQSHSFQAHSPGHGAVDKSVRVQITLSTEDPAAPK